jgi:hypothetical protein
MCWPMNTGPRRDSENRWPPRDRVGCARYDSSTESPVDVVTHRSVQRTAAGPKGSVAAGISRTSHGSLNVSTR